MERFIVTIRPKMVTELMPNTCWFSRSLQSPNTADTTLRIFQIYVHWMQEQHWGNRAPQSIMDFFEPDVFEAFFARYNGTKTTASRSASAPSGKKPAACRASWRPPKPKAREWYDYVGEELLNVQQFLEPALARKRPSVMCAM